MGPIDHMKGTFFNYHIIPQSYPNVFLLGQGVFLTLPQKKSQQTKTPSCRASAGSTPLSPGRCSEQVLKNMHPFGMFMNFHDCSWVLEDVLISRLGTAKIGGPRWHTSWGFHQESWGFAHHMQNGIQK